MNHLYYGDNLDGCKVSANLSAPTTWSPISLTTQFANWTQLR